MYQLVSVPLTMAQATQPNPKAQMVQMFLMLGTMGIMFYFVLIRPQQKKAKEHAKLLETIKMGDKIVTNSGIIGTVVSVKDKHVAIRSADSKLEVLKSAVGEVMERAGGAAASEK